jgi:hypothetical protein
MASFKTITSANSVYMLQILDLFPTAQQLQGYSTDAAFATESYDPVEAMMGVDGIMSAGWVPVIKKQTISLQADSSSCDIFDAWNSAQQTARELYFAMGTIVLPALGKEYTMWKGVLSTYVPHAEAAKTLRFRQFGITWAEVLPASI